MSNTKSAKKAIRVSARKNVINLRTKRSYKTAVKDVKKALVKKDAKKAETDLSKAYKEIDKAVKKNVIHKNTAARYKSKLAKKVSSK